MKPKTLVITTVVAVVSASCVPVHIQDDGTGASQASLRPPMHRAWTHISGENTSVLAVRDGTVYFVSRQRTGALRLNDGSVVWEKKRPDWVQDFAIDDNRIYVSTSGKDHGRLLSYDLKDGTERALRDLPEDVSAFAVLENTVYLLDVGRKVVAFDADSGKQRWEAKLDAKEHGGFRLDSIHLCNGVLVLAISDVGWECLDPETGKSLWKKAAQYATNEEPYAVGNGVLLQQPDVALVDPRTGKELWSRADLSIDNFGVSNGVIVARSNGQTLGLDVKTGKTLWAIGKKTDVSMIQIGGHTSLWQSDADGVLVMSNGVARISRDGKTLWSSPAFFDGGPDYVDGHSMVTDDYSRILCYVGGPYAAMPEGDAVRKAFVEAGIANYAVLDQTERKALAKEPQYAAGPLIRRYVEWARIKKANHDSDVDDDLGMLRYDLMEDSSKTLHEICGREQTDQLKKAIADLGENEYRDTLVAILGEKGDPDKFMDDYVSELRASRGDEERMRNSAQTLDAVANSKYPSAVAYMIEILKDPTAPDDWRHEAFIHLPRTGGEAGVDTVRAVRAKRAARLLWEDHIDVGGVTGKDVVSEKTDAKGHTWRLFRSGVLGNYSDLYVSERVGSAWSKPLFVGVYTAKTWHGQAPTEFRGTPMKSFLDSDWIKILPGDSEIRKDTDGDGLTDVVEKRLGTDPKNPDTDGDGLGEVFRR